MTPDTPADGGRPAEGARVTVAFHSDRGHIEKLARSLAAGAAELEGVTASVHPVDELTDGMWDALDASDAIVFGSPTYMGGPSAVFKRFADASLPIWVRRGWTSKVAAGFTHSQAMSGDKLNTLQYFNILAAQHGMVWVNLDLLPGWCRQDASIDDLNRLGSWLGAMSQSDGDGPLAVNPRPSDLQTAHHLGRQVAGVTLALVLGRAQTPALHAGKPSPLLLSR
jgi:NAD(P)H dehydrogenase (quinone)